MVLVTQASSEVQDVVVSAAETQGMVAGSQCRREPLRIRFGQANITSFSEVARQGLEAFVKDLDVVLLQETKVLERDVPAFRKRWHWVGFRCFCSPAKKIEKGVS